MSARTKGLLLAAVQLAVVLSLGAKLLYDRATRPRVWVQAEVWDPELPIRGRYLGERLHVRAEGFTYRESKVPADKRPDFNANEWYLNRQWAYFELRGGELVAKSEGAGSGEWVHLGKNGDGTLTALTEEPVLIFIPDTGAVAPKLQRGEELWVEVTVPKAGPPRPIRLGVKKDGVITPVKFE